MSSSAMAYPGSTRPVVLVVEDDSAVRVALRRALVVEGFDVHVAADGEEALAVVDDDRPGAIVLDVGLPGIDGVEVARRLREDGHEVPICMLSARSQVAERVAGLEAGADDYVVKPFDVDELAARLRSLLRRARVPGAAPVRAGDVSVDPLRHLARRGDRVLALTPREFTLLEVLVRHSGQVLGRQQLLELVWGYAVEVDTNVVDVFIGYLRRKLEEAGEPRIVHTVRGIGYVLRAGETP
jgi:two-component system, OmpR family, response regulator PrrA